MAIHGERLSRTGLAIGKHRDLQETGLHNALHYEDIIWSKNLYDSKNMFRQVIIYIYIYICSMEMLKYTLAATSGSAAWLPMAVKCCPPRQTPVIWLRRWGPHIVSIQCRLHQISTGIEDFCLDQWNMIDWTHPTGIGTCCHPILYWWNDGWFFSSPKSRKNSRTSICELGYKMG